MYPQFVQGGKGAYYAPGFRNLSRMFARSLCTACALARSAQRRFAAINLEDVSPFRKGKRGRVWAVDYSRSCRFRF